LTSDWGHLREQRFDLVFASLVLQHIEPAAVRAYVADFARMAPAVYLLTRARNDFGPSTLSLVDPGLWQWSQCTVVEHDDVSQQLRALGVVAAADVVDAADDRHFETVLMRRASSGR
jgi:hypothetical protein